MKYLAIDYGTKNVGIAVSDPAGEFAFPHKVLEGGDEAKLVAEIAALAHEEGIEFLVVGLPLKPEGEAHALGPRVEKFAEKLKAATGLPLELFDERFTTQLVTKLRSEIKDSYARDDVAAAVLLQNVIDRRSGSKKA